MVTASGVSGGSRQARIQNVYLGGLSWKGGGLAVGTQKCVKYLYANQKVYYGEQF